MTLITENIGSFLYHLFTMIRGIIFLIVGVIIGALGVYTLAPGLQTQLRTAQSGQPPLAQVPSQNPPGTSSAQQNLDQLRSQLYQQGMTVQATVDSVFPGVGFIVKDDAGERLFVRWDQNMPTAGQAVDVKGTVQRISGQEDFRSNPGFSQDLSSFLNGQTIYIQGQEVTPR